MKKYIFLSITFCLMLAFSATAQSRNELKGPKAKNYKVWENDEPAKPVLFKTGESTKGAKAKNQRPLERKNGETVVANTSGTTKKLQGPAAKNKKPWM